MKIIIFGSGEIGGQIAEAFFEEHDITVIDRAERLLVNVNKLDLSVIAGFWKRPELKTPTSSSLVLTPTKPILSRL